MPNILDIIVEPNPLLHKKSLPVDSVDDSLRGFMGDMLATMHHNNGVGLAAVQVGVLKKIIVIDVGKEFANGVPMPLFMVNAEIVKRSEDLAEFREGCLSVPGFFAEVTRPADITVKFINYEGKEEGLNIPHGLLAVCVQHEIDHTNGIVFIDYLSKLKKDFALKKSLKFQERA
ncbi:MAG: peptide deformylase [Candidatus Midichloria mitochondrii]|nr:peptide deformylase [Candidatus Midichloria mitochondrii]MDJ1256075.1 peptide deformylase [Candidatus Midichloria mitochondrii]MDJ1287773.1 peptide deformylase [Candidatus Midichloria mitochondrii]MDJ1298741.1 peptide deformylase [Candidatus Midichloria mitochondrii]MDJ1312623.1 peptide deformylase [Candidatus Midichloria mitochondrii]